MSDCCDKEDPLDNIVAVHLAAFPGFFMTQLGPRFLREYYGCVANYPRGILLTETEALGCTGFVAGFIDPASFYRALRNRRLRLGLAACVGILTRPARLFALVGNYRRAEGAARHAPDPWTAELSSLAVHPGAAGRGVGKQLVRRFMVAAREQGARRVVLTTEADDNEAVNIFYQRLGFTCVRKFEARRGRLLNEYVIVLPPEEG